MDEILSKLNTSTVATVVIVIFTIIIFIYSKRLDIKELWDFVYNSRKKRENLIASVETSQNKIKETQDEIKQIMDNRIHDREQSLKIQKEQTDAQGAIIKSIEDIRTMIDTMKQEIVEMKNENNARFLANEQKENMRVQAEIKERISQSYRYFHSCGKISDMELEALEDLITTYENYGGKNSFVHSVVQKEMYSWEKYSRS